VGADEVRAPLRPRRAGSLHAPAAGPCRGYARQTGLATTLPGSAKSCWQVRRR
jgi:hypothetical protein